MSAKKKILFRYLIQSLVLFAPVVILKFSVGNKTKAELVSHLCVSFFVISLVLVYEYYDLYVPVNNLRKFREWYLPILLDECEEKFGKNIRINILIAERLWFFPFIKIFRWKCGCGYKTAEADHPDQKLKFTTWQGVSGVVYRCKEPKFIDFTEIDLQSLSKFDWCVQVARVVRGIFYKAPKEGHNLSTQHIQKNKLWFLPWQLSQINGVKAILSVPIMKENTKGTWCPLGVINLDTVEDSLVYKIKNIERVDVDKRLLIKHSGTIGRMF